MSGPSCPGCEKKLKEAHPLLAEWFHVAKKHEPDVHISWTFRTKEQQEMCNKIGTSKSIWPTSKHNNMVGGWPYSLAMDLFFQIDGVYAAPIYKYKALASVLKSEGCPLEHGGDWSEKDWPHWQLKKDMPPSAIIIKAA